MNRLVLIVLAALCLSPAFAQSATPAAATTAAAEAPQPDALTKADELFHHGRFIDAAKAYHEIVKADPDSLMARVALVRCDIEMNEISEAAELAEALVAKYPFSAAAHVAAGDVAFRSAHMGDAEKEYLAALKIDNTSGRAYFGLSRLYKAYSLNRKAFDALIAANAYAPDDIDIRREYADLLPRKQLIVQLERSAKAEGEEPDADFLKLLKAIESQPHGCKQVNPLAKMETHLEPIMYNAKILREWGLKVGVNGQFATMLLDTGASGITISRKAAARAGLTSLGASQVHGIGDAGAVESYIAIAKSIRVGALEFENCIVEVMDRPDVADEDGLIGSDVFSDFLVDIDYPAETLRLLPLPPLPDEAAHTTALASNALAGDSKDSKKADSFEPKTERLKYHDAYVAPEMKGWTKFYRLGHDILVPTFVNHNPEHLFLVDTGASHNMLAANFAREITKVGTDRFATLEGLNGKVKQVFSARKAEIQFGAFRTKDFDVMAFDLSRISRSSGTEVSGILGFEMLRILETKIDYRDGLISFTYDAAKNRLPNFNNRRDVLDYK